MPSPPFHFKKFSLNQDGAVHPVGMDSVLLGAWGAGGARILDIGTGTGAIALMMAQRFPAAEVLGLDVHADTLDCAQRNVAASPWADRIRLWHGAVQDFQPDARYNAVLSNPPYFSETTVSPDTERRLGRHIASLRPGDLIDAVLRAMSAEGHFSGIWPWAEGKRFAQMAAMRGLYLVQECTVYTRREKGPERLLQQYSRQPRSFARSELTVYAAGEQYSDAFRALTEDFYQ